MKNKSLNLFTNDWPNRFFSARMRNVRWVRGLEKLSNTHNTSNNQEQEESYVGTQRVDDPETIQDIEDRLNSKT